MSDPKRLLASAEESASLRQLLKLEASATPPSFASASVWKSVWNELGSHGVASPIASASAPVSVITMKSALGIVGLLAAGSVLYSLSDIPHGNDVRAIAERAGSAIEIPPETTLLSPDPSPVSSAASPHEALSIEETSVSKPTARPVAPVVQASRARNNEASSSLRDEAALLESARYELQMGRGERALALTLEHKKRFSHACLTEERKVIEIEALRHSGKGAQANDQAKAFAREYPDSVHLERVEH